MNKSILFFILLFLSLTLGFEASTKAFAGFVNGVEVSDSLVDVAMDSIQQNRWQQTPFLDKDVKVITQIEKPFQFQSKTASFYLVLGLLLILGFLRKGFPVFFRNLYQSFMNPTVNKRLIKDQIEQNVAANWAMNVFFCISLGLFVFVILTQDKNFFKTYDINQDFLLLGIIIAIGIVYSIKFVALKFVGWTFNISQTSDDYLYNVFLINKIIGILLLPFTIILSFGSGNWLQIIFLISMLLLLILIINRYIRSWSSLGTLFHFSKFHFFMYFCTSEILPIAVLVKFTFNLLSNYS